MRIKIQENKDIVNELLKNTTENKLGQSDKANHQELVPFSVGPSQTVNFCHSPGKENFISDQNGSSNSYKNTEVLKKEVSSLKDSLKEKDKEILELNMKNQMMNEKNVQYQIKLVQTTKSEMELEKLRIQCIGNANSKQLLQDKIKELEKQVFSKSKNESIEYLANLKESLKPALTSNQIEIILGKKKFAKWNQNEIGNAFTLRYFSKRGYLFLKNTLKYPLPAISSLQRWASKIEMRNGLVPDILRMLDLMGKDKPDKERAVVILFDEMKVEKIYEYDPKHDEVIGPYNNLQVVMARGLFGNWKQPIYMKFDTQVSTEILNNIITELHKINYTVVGMVSDCGGGNRGLWNDLNISPEKFWFNHPISDEKIYVIPDAPHLLKLLRNWLLDTGNLLHILKCVI